MGALGQALRAHVGLTLRDVRHAIGWSQAELGRRAGLSQSEVSKIERAAVPELTFETAARVLEVLGVKAILELRRPFLANGGLQRDRAHAKCVAYVARRLRHLGWDVRLEVEVQAGAARGWIDILAYRASDRLLLVIEVKTLVDDVGHLQRQVGWYESRAWHAARAMGWRPAVVGTVVAMLATSENAQILADNRELLGAEFGLSVEDFANWIREGGSSPDRGRRRTIAMVDPRDRSRTWLRRSPLEGRSRRWPYEDLTAFRATLPSIGRRSRRPTSKRQLAA